MPDGWRSQHQTAVNCRDNQGRPRRRYPWPRTMPREPRQQRPRSLFAVVRLTARVGQTDPGMSVANEGSDGASPSSRYEIMFREPLMAAPPPTTTCTMSLPRRAEIASGEATASDPTRWSCFRPCARGAGATLREYGSASSPCITRITITTTTRRTEAIGSCCVSTVTRMSTRATTSPAPIASLPTRPTRRRPLTSHSPVSTDC